MHERIVGSSNLNVELMVALLSFWYRRSLGPFLSASVFYGIWFQVKVRKVLITLPLLLWNHHLQYTMSVLSWALANQWYDCPLTLCMHMYGDNFICPFSPRIGFLNIHFILIWVRGPFSARTMWDFVSPRLLKREACAGSKCFAFVGEQEHPNCKYPC